MNQSWKTWSIQKLEEAVVVLDELFYEGEDTVYDGRIVSNSEYDFIRKRLEKEKPDSDVLKKVTNNKVAWTTIKHHPPFASLNKINREEEQDKYADLMDWIGSRFDDIGWGDFDINSQFQKHFVQAYKLDGVALRIYYENGKLVKAGLRPQDGINGEDVTANAKYIAGIPSQLPIPLTLSISGEVICNISDFEEINKQLLAAGKKLRKNPRNHAAGAIRQFKDPKKTAEGKLRFVGYGIDNFVGKLPYRDEIQRAKWCNQELKVPFVQVRPLLVKDLREMEQNVPNLDYEVDGVVISVRVLEEQEQCGKHGNSATGNPKGKVAWKFSEQFADIVVKSFDLQMGRTGRMVPVLEFDGVPLAGTIVSRATGHNCDYVTKNEITIGTVVRIIKSGKIIPKVIEVIDNKGIFKFPKNCPSCDSELIETNCDKVCTNSNCKSRGIANFHHYLKTFGVKGVGDAIVTELIENDLIKEWSDFYKLDEESFSKTNLSERQAAIAIAGIHMIKNPSSLDDDELKNQIQKVKSKKKLVKAAQFIGSLGCPTVGKTLGQVLIDHFRSLDKILEASVEDLSAVPDVGGVTASNLVSFLKNNKKEIQNLLQYVELELPKTGKLNGKTFCLSGTLPGGESKEYWQSKIEEAGGVVKGSVGKTLSYLVAGEGSGSKSEKAEQYGVSIIDLDQLKKLL